MSRVKSHDRVPKAKRDTLRRHLELFDRIDVVSDEMRNLIEECFLDFSSPKSRDGRQRITRHEANIACVDYCEWSTSARVRTVSASAAPHGQRFLAVWSEW